MISAILMLLRLAGAFACRVGFITPRAEVEKAKAAAKIEAANAG